MKIRTITRCRSEYKKEKYKIQIKFKNQQDEYVKQMNALQNKYKIKSEDKIYMDETLVKFFIDSRSLSIIDRKLLDSIHSRISDAVNKQDTIRYGNFHELLGCSFEFYKEFLSDQFEPWMTLKNHGINTWHIDHILPCSSFDLTNSEKQKACFHYTNTQPLLAQDNIDKGAKLDWVKPSR